MSTSVQIYANTGVSLTRLPPVPWRDPHTVSPAELDQHIAMLETACEQNPLSADLRTCLGMAYAMRFEAYKSMDTLEAATKLDPTHFFARFKYAELHYRLRALDIAEAETLEAMELAANAWELSLARKQLAEIRRLRREGTQKPEWNKPLTMPAVALVLLFVVFSLVTLWR
jgi:tetratricopeptide (TPR) repeat protein